MIRATSKTARIDLRRGSRGRGGKAIKNDTWTTTSEAEGGVDLESPCGSSLGSCQRDSDDGRVVDGLDLGHWEIGSAGAAHREGRRRPRGHARVGWMHYGLVGCVLKPGRSAVNCADTEDDACGAGCGGDRFAGGGSSTDTDGGRGNLVFATVQDHGIAARLHGGGSECAGRFRPVLCCATLPVDYTIGGDTADGPRHETTAASGDKASDGKRTEEAEVKAAGGGTTRGEDETVWAVQTHAVGLGLDVAGVHVEVQLLLSAALVVDVTEETSRSQRSTLTFLGLRCATHGPPLDDSYEYPGTTIHTPTPVPVTQCTWSSMKRLLE